MGMKRISPLGSTSTVRELLLALVTGETRAFIAAEVEQRTSSFSLNIGSDDESIVSVLRLAVESEGEGGRGMARMNASTVIVRSSYEVDYDEAITAENMTLSLHEVGISHGTIVELQVVVDQPRSAQKARTHVARQGDALDHALNVAATRTNDITVPTQLFEPAPASSYLDNDEALARALMQSDINDDNKDIGSNSNRNSNRNSNSLPRPPDAPKREALVGGGIESTFLNTCSDEIVSQMNRSARDSGAAAFAAQRNSELSRRLQIGGNEDAPRRRSSLTRAGHHYTNQTAASAPAPAPHSQITDPSLVFMATTDVPSPPTTTTPTTATTTPPIAANEDDDEGFQRAIFNALSEQNFSVPRKSEINIILDNDDNDDLLQQVLLLSHVEPNVTEEDLLAEAIKASLA